MAGRDEVKQRGGLTRVVIVDDHQLTVSGLAALLQQHDDLTLDGDVARLAAGRLRPGALVVVERSARSAPVSWPDAIGETWNRRYGETTLYFGIEGAR